MRRLTPDQIRQSLDYLYIYESTSIGQDELARRFGLSQSQMSRRLALARRYRQEEAQQGLKIDLALAPGTEPDDDRPVVGGEDVEWLELVEAVPDMPSRGYYDLESDATSADGTTRFILVGTGRGGQPRRNRIGSGGHVDTGQRYETQKDGLKGGMG